MSVYDNKDVEDYVKELSPGAQAMFTDGGTPCGSHFGKGWWPVIREALEAVALLDPLCKVDQIKEKFGGLRLYVSPVDRSDQVYTVVDEAEKQCWRICEDCGTYDAVATGGRGWVRTLCPACRGAWDSERSRGVKR